MAPLSKLFRRPLVVWVPECLNGGKAECISPKCLCTPRVKDALRLVPALLRHLPAI
ncbi:hypothetical protein PPTG_24913 [Phytophthora nicotianae INRA-310]|uniref:Uncharacterized protein n=1 Tax=Phytophthora nicotianae (strain INRA-310) TaxID=761204 RepID=W2P940_PHYN3|nr:hypothetical protein PPTG_24913 [Phytophthora nicotianae INRA-310]ETM97547.1 hypothetical protein PPTG_24913 [Phytophthora nicotianae INRA-310]